MIIVDTSILIWKTIYTYCIMTMIIPIWQK
jgi:hypothetical protein